MSPEQLAIKKYNSRRPYRAKHLPCHAPFSSINFTQNGDMLACCYNHTEILGTYPRQSIKEAWEGKVAQTLRAYMKQNELPAGCDGCKEQILSGNYSGSRAIYYDKYASLLTMLPIAIRPPKVFEFEISNICNLECIMCNGYFSSAIRANREKLPKINTPYDDAFVEDVKNYIPHLTDAKFLGGEPFLISQYFEIWDAIITINPKVQVHITTNGTVLNKRAKACLEKMRAGIIVSIDSLNKENYEQIRVNGDFDVLMENIRWLIEYRNRKGLYLSFAVCPMISNRKYLADIVRFCNENEIYIHFNTVWKPDEECLLNTSSQNLAQLIFEISEIQFGKTAIQKVNKERTGDFLAHLRSWHKEQEKHAGETVRLIDLMKDDNASAALSINSKKFLQEIIDYYDFCHQQERPYIQPNNRLAEKLMKMADEMGHLEFREAWMETMLYAAKRFFDEPTYMIIKSNLENISSLSETFEIEAVNRRILENFDFMATLKTLRDSTSAELKTKLHPIQ